jgi:hypothetical protein
MVRAGWLAASLAMTGGAVGLALHHRGRGGPAAVAASPDAVATSANAEELESLRNAVRALDRRAAALETQLAAARAAAAAGTDGAAPGPGKDQGRRSPAELRRDTLASLDAALAAERGDARAHAANAETLSRSITEAARGKARVVGVQCTSSFCKAVFEWDTATTQPLDVNAVLELPALKTESMFDYQTEGGRKRTTVYAAREGQKLPLPRAPLPEGWEVPAAAASQR